MSKYKQKCKSFVRVGFLLALVVTLIPAKSVRAEGVSPIKSMDFQVNYQGFKAITADTTYGDILDQVEENFSWSYAPQIDGEYDEMAGISFLIKDEETGEYDTEEYYFEVDNSEVDVLKQKVDMDSVVKIEYYISVDDGTTDEGTTLFDMSSDATQPTIKLNGSQVSYSKHDQKYGDAWAAALASKSDVSVEYNSVWQEYAFFYVNLGTIEELQENVEKEIEKETEPEQKPTSGLVETTPTVKKNETSPTSTITGISDTAKEALVAGLTDNERALYNAGADMNIYLEVEDISQKVTDTEKALLEGIKNDNNIGMYIDLSMYLKVGTEAERKVSNPGGEITITLDMPESLKNTDAAMTRTYTILHVHEGETEAIPATYDAATGKLTFKTAKFSTFAIAYKDVSNTTGEQTAATDGTSSPKTGDTAWPMAMFILLVSGIGGAYVLKRRDSAESR